MLYIKDNKQRHQYDNMHISATVTFVQILAKSRKVHNAAKNHYGHQAILSFTKKENSIHVLVIVATSTEFALIISVTEYQH